MNAWERWYKFLELWGHRRGHYVRTFGGDNSDAQAVLKDLAWFCCANRNTWHEQPQRRDVLIGRREVWLRIQQHLNLSSAEMAALAGFSPPKEDTTDG